MEPGGLILLSDYLRGRLIDLWEPNKNPWSCEGLLDQKNRNMQPAMELLSVSMFLCGFRGGRIQAFI